MKVLVTGTLGFIFSNFVRRVIDRTGYRFVGVDKAAKPYNLENEFDHRYYKSHLADITDAHVLGRIFQLEKPDVVIGAAAESFVDDSIENPIPFLGTNVIGTQNLIDCCIRHKARYIHVSTDEVYGQKLSRDEVGWTEDSPLGARNPYAVSKACAELVVKCAHNTHGLQYQMTRSCNVYGPRQKKENLVPHIITRLMDGQPARIHGNGRNFRQYIYVDDVIDGIMTVLEKGEMNATYNIGGDWYLSNLEMVEQVANRLFVKPDMVFIDDRKAHDFGYSVDSSKLRALGWAPKVGLNDGLNRTISYFTAKRGHDAAA